MKNKLIVSLVLFPLLTGCSGMPISREDALDILKNIESNVASNSSLSYKATSVTTQEESEIKTINIYSKENKFYHTYTISNQKHGNVSESWKFVMSYTTKTDGDDVVRDYIFDITRYITQVTINQDLEKQYIVTYEKYSDETWEKYASEYENRLGRRFSDAIDHSRSLISDLENKLDLKSLNGNSIFLNCKQSNKQPTISSNEYELVVTNNQLLSIKTKYSETNKVETTYEYNTGDIVYPNFKVTIVS